MQMKSATLVHMLVQDLNQNFKLNSYEKYLEDYPEYKKLIENETDTIFGGRLGDFKYYDMHQVIASALKCVGEEVW